MTYVFDLRVKTANIDYSTHKKKIFSGEKERELNEVLKESRIQKRGWSCNRSILILTYVSFSTWLNESAGRYRRATHLDSTITCKKPKRPKRNGWALEYDTKQ